MRVYTVADRKLTPVRSPLFHPFREEEFDEYFEDMFLWLPPSAACHPAVTTLPSPLTLSIFPSQCACKMFSSFFPPVLFCFVLSPTMFKRRGRNKPNVYSVTSLFWFCSLSARCRTSSHITVCHTGETRAERKKIMLATVRLPVCLFFHARRHWPGFTDWVFSVKLANSFSKCQQTHTYMQHEPKSASKASVPSL